MTKILKRNPTNPIGKPLADLRNRCTDVALEKRIECGVDDVLTNCAGGYHYRDWMVVRVVGDWARALGIEPDDTSAAETSIPAVSDIAEPDEALNERQRWILDQVRGGTRLSQKDVLGHFRSKWNNSTIKRDLKGLRDACLLKTGADGYYACV